LRSGTLRTGLAVALVVTLAIPALSTSSWSGRLTVGASLPGSGQASPDRDIEVAPAFQATGGVTPEGPLPAAAPVSVAVGLASQDPNGLDAFVAALLTPGTPEYRHPLSAPEAATRFGASPAAVRAAETYFQRFGLGTTVSPDGLIVYVAGPSSGVAQAFGTTFDQYRTSDGRLVYDHPTSATLPAIAPWTGAAGLGNLTPIVPAVAGSASPLVATPAASCPGSSAYLPCTIESAYDMTSLLASGKNGSGERVAVVDAYSGDEDQSQLESDLTTFAGLAGIPVGKVDYLYPVPSNASLNTSGTNPGWDLEEALDLEWARAIAPGATIDMTFSPNAGPGLYEAVDRLVGEGEADVISLSWGEPDVGIFNVFDTPCSTACNASTDGSYAVLGPVLELAAAEGIGVMAASGDCGAADGTSGVSTNFPASDPYVTGVGATQLTVSGGSWSSEVAWSGNSSGATSPGCRNLGGSGGGYAPFPRPWWQAGLPSKPTGRGVPDVSINGAAGSPVYVEFQGSGVPVSGTSVGTPIWASIEAVADQDAGTDLGFLDPSLYSILEGSHYASDFHDITSGSNGYDAGPGWDAVTGIGSPIVGALVPALVRGGGLPGGDLAAYVKVSPTSGTAPLTVTATPTISGGSGTYPLIGVAFGPLNSSLTAGGSVPYTFTTPGVYAVQAFAFDSGGNATVSAPVAVVVGGGNALSVTLKASSSTPAVGAADTFTATVTGGTAPFSYDFWFGDGSVSGLLATDPTTHAYGTAGGFCAAVTVFDSAKPQDGGSSAAIPITVGGAAAPSCAGPRPPSFAITFAETGLPGGSKWSVTLNGTTVNATGTSVQLARSNGTYNYSVTAPLDYFATPSNGSVTVDGAPVTVPLVFAQTPGEYLVTVDETGLPTGANWSVTLSTSATANATSPGPVVFVLGNGSYTFRGTALNRTYEAGGSFAVGGADASATAAFEAVVFAVTFTESGLPSGTAWFVNATGGGSFGGSGTSIAFNETNGSYPYTIATADKRYSAPGGKLTVDGASVSEPVVFSEVTFAVTFTETGLPSGTEWYVNLSGEPSLNSISWGIVTYLPNGTHPYSVGCANRTFAASPGSVDVDGSAVGQPVGFSQVTYAVAFEEAGLATGTSWSVTLGARLGSSTTATVTFPEPNGSYAYAVTPVPGYTLGTASGNVPVHGGGAQVDVVFTVVTYAVTFTEGGLPAGTEWWVNLSGQPSLGSTTGSAATDLPNGSYAYTIGWSDRQYLPSGPSSGSLEVNGAPTSSPVTFVPSPAAPPSGTVGLPPTTVDAIVGAIAAVSVAFAAGVLLSRRRRK